MSNFKPGDKVIMKDHITGETIQKFGIDEEMINKMKEKVLTIRETWTDGDEIYVVELKDIGYVWRAEWFRHYSNIPEEFFEIE